MTELTRHAQETLDLLTATGMPQAEVDRLREWAGQIAAADGRERAGVGDVQAARLAAGAEFLPEVDDADLR